ncbi:fusarubin cluster-polyketide synthase [Xanthoria calcicola]
MPKQQQKLYLFGDQTYDVRLHLKDLLRDRSNPILEDFLAKAYNAIRREIYTLPPQARDDLPRFTCLDDLVLWKQVAQRCVPLDMAVTCMYQIGIFISHEHSKCQYPDPEQDHILGICTGALAASAVSCSRNMLDLVLLGVEAIIVAFRTGVHVHDTAQRIEPSQDLDQSWSMIVGGTEAAGMVQAFCEQSMLPMTKKPYISAYAPRGITVSGPPGSLSQLRDSPGSAKVRSTNAPIHAPYHSSHLFSKADVEHIIGDIASNLIAQPKRVPVLSGDGTTVKGGDFGILLRIAVEQILLHPIRWDSVIHELQAWLRSSSSTAVSPSAFSLVPIASNQEQLVYTALQQKNLRSVLPPSAPLSTSSRSEEVAGPSPKQPKLAIIGMAGRFPGAKDNEAFWDLLYKGLDLHKPVPALHWDAKTHVDPTGAAKNTSATPFGCWLDDPAAFDARFFNISPREAAQMDPAQRLGLMTAYEAIEQSGIVPDETPSTRRDRVGVYYGVTSNDWMETNSAQAIDTYFIPGGNRAFIPGRINYFFQFSGPSYAVDTACSSSLAGIHLACQSLWRGDIDTAIAGGTNVLTNPDFTAGLDRGHFLSRTGNCKTFDNDADGYCRGEGIGTVIIKRLEDAVADNDPIQAVILGADTNHSAESESITRPHSGAQQALFSKMLSRSALDPYDIDYVEMHGTGTQAGDAAEMTSVLHSFAPALDEVKKARTDDQALYIGSAKANIGHGEAASGVSSLIKVILMMHKNTIVPHCGIKTTINHKFPTDLDKRNVRIAFQPKEWKRSAEENPRRAFVNNFSAAGGNSVLLVEDAPIQHEIPNLDSDARSVHLIAVSGKNGTSLQGNLRSMLGFLKQNPDVRLDQLSYTTTARRLHHMHRVMLTGSQTDELCKQIDTAIQDGTGMKRPKSTPKIVFTFTGNGAQYPGMGKQLCDNFSRFRNEIQKLDQIGRNLGFPSVMPVIESEEQDISIFAPVVVQLATTCLQIALTRLWASWGILPMAVVGHSLGEYAALHTAGVLSDSDAIYLVGKRAQLLEEKCAQGTHSMLVVMGSLDAIASVLGNTEFEVACINSPKETVVAGLNEEVSKFQSLLSDAGIKSTLLQVPYAFHSSQMNVVLEPFEKLAAGATYAKPKIPVLCPLDGSVITEEGRLGPHYLARHCREPVNFRAALATAVSHKIITDLTTTLEVGPHPAVSGMVKAELQTHTLLVSMQRGRSPLQVLAGTLKTLYAAGADIRWLEYHRDFKASHKVLPLPAYSWDLKDYWMQYVNDWSLRKGDPPLVINAGAPRKVESTTIHRVVEESGSTDKTHIVVEADIARKDLSPLVQGHEVDGIPLCTPSVYADMALSMGTYLIDRYQPAKPDRLLDISDMSVSKALILKEKAGEQLLQAHSDVDWSSNAATTIFMSFDANGNLQEHARCVVRFQDRSLQEKMQKDAIDTKRKMQTLRDGIVSGDTARFNRPMAYRAIRPLARFHDDFRAIDEMVLNSSTLETSSKLSFGSVKRDGDFYTHPAIIDALTQSCGFTMNCKDDTDLDNEVFMNHGWGGFQIFEPISFDKEYTTYTQMREGTGGLWHGDVAIFDGDDVVASFKQVTMQSVPRRVLKVILSIESGAKSQPNKAAPKTATAPAAISKTASVPPKSQHVSRPEVKATASSNGAGAQALTIIADESGIDRDDLTDNLIFSDAGIDSLMGLTISARFKEEMDIDFDFNALFYDYPTVKALKEYLGDSAADPNLVDDVAEVDTPSSTTSGTTTPQENITGATTPNLGNLVSFQRALAIISEESGVAVEDFTDDTSFADSGVDSLLSLVIVSRLRDELDLDISQDSLFLECQLVGDLKRLLVEDADHSNDDISSAPLAEAKPSPVDASEPAAPNRTPKETAALTTRMKAVEEYVEKYTAGFSAPTSTSSKHSTSDDEKVILVTGATGGLGAHLAFHLAQLPEVKTVICMNRDNKTEGHARQYKSMRDKGIRFPDTLKHKLQVLQTDTAKPRFGLTEGEYQHLVASVTHLIHNAWPMSAKRPLSGFESQFQVMRNLVDFACETASARPASFKFGFQMVSSIGVVGQYDHGCKTKIVVPEERVGIESVLPNGYGEAKWGCEWMLDRTLHRHPDRFRTMAVRLGQIAGSETSGYWNPMEHFGFLVKSSQTLGVLPEMGGGLYWTPVNAIAGTLSDLILADHTPHPIYHVENPVGQSWREMTSILAEALHISASNVIPFDRWLERVRNAPQKNNPASTLIEFLEDNFLRMSCGGLVLDTKKTLEHSKTLRGVGPVSETVARKYIYIWREIGFLASTEEEKAQFPAERARLWGYE